MEYNKFTVVIQEELLNDTNGQVTDVGVLVTDDPGGFLFLFIMSGGFVTMSHHHNPFIL